MPFLWEVWRQELVIVRPETLVVHWNIAESDTPAWTAQHGVEALPFDAVPGYPVCDRDVIHGRSLVQWVAGLGIQEKVIASRSPWQNPIAGRLIGSIRRECLDRVIVPNELHLARLMTESCDFDHVAKTHRSLGQDAPHPRPSSDGRAWSRSLPYRVLATHRD